MARMACGAYALRLPLAKWHQHWKPHDKAEKLPPMNPALRTFALALTRLNLWIAALLVVGLLHDQPEWHSRLGAQLSAQPVNTLSLVPKFALAKPAPAEARARLTPLLDPESAVRPSPPSGFRLLHRADVAALPRLTSSHGWQARAPPVLMATALI